MTVVLLDTVFLYSAQTEQLYLATLPPPTTGPWTITNIC